MFDEALLNVFEQLDAAAWTDVVKSCCELSRLRGHGDWNRWVSVIEGLPVIESSRVDCLAEVRIGSENDISDSVRHALESMLKALHPWRKGPYEIFGIYIDTEWRSDWKWNRLIGHIAPLNNRLVLDVGCGNGYHCWRAWGAGAKTVIGIDPMFLNVAQFAALKRLTGRQLPVYVLPMGIENVPPGLGIFDTVFSMGVLYHRRSPLDHLLELKQCLRPGGELVLETLVIEGDVSSVLLPGQRYAQMRNVWFLPSVDALQNWLVRCGFKNVRVCDVSKTTIEEQRTTEWMTFQSLADFLNPDDHDLTVEGYPAPMRAIVLANV